MQGMERQTWLLSWMGDGGVDNLGWKDGKGSELNLEDHKNLWKAQGGPCVEGMRRCRDSS